MKLLVRSALIRFPVLLLLLFGLGCGIAPKSNSSDLPTISEGTYEDRPHYIITTKTAIFYLDSKGGGFSRLLDSEGNDWIGFKKQPWGKYPESAASAFRGMPNLVHGGEDSGAGHPGHDKCVSKILDSQTIVVESLSGLWQWQYTFFDDYVQLSVLKTDPERKYWFLYEGTPGGRYDPSSCTYGTNLSGPHTDAPDYYKQEPKTGNFDWVYFSHIEKKNTLFIAQQQKDALPDTFSYLGNSKAGVASSDGMTVMGFGRDAKTQPYLSGKTSFIIGFFEGAIKNSRNHLVIENHISKLLKEEKVE